MMMDGVVLLLVLFNLIPRMSKCSWCYDFSSTRVEHTFSSSFLDYLTLAVTCAEGSFFISILLLT